MTRRLATVLVTSMLALCSLPTNAFGQKILVTYYSLTGHTEAMAKAVARGARSARGADVRLLTIDKTSKSDLLWADAIIVGSPVYMTNVAAPVLQAIYGWPHAGLKDKIGAAFVTGGEISGGQELTNVHLLATLLMENMIIVGGPDWSQAFGASAITMEKPFADEQNKGVVDPMFLRKGEALGKRVAEIARRFAAAKRREKR